MRLKLGICILGIMALTIGTNVYALSIEGQVRNGRRGPNYETYLKNVKVYAKGNPQNAVYTDDLGKYKLDGVDDNEQFIVFEGNGYVPDMKKIAGSKLDMALIEKGLTTISDDRFFNYYVNLEFEGMEKVKAALEKGDILLAKYEMINYYRERKTPVWNVVPQKPENITPDNSYSTLQVDQELAHNFTNGGVTANSDDPPGSGDINWLFVPKGDREWLWGINRAFTILHMGTAWEKTLDSKYAYEYMAQYIDWIADNPMPFFKDTQNTWRTIEAGIRNHYPLPNSWFSLLFNEDVSTEARITILKSNIEHMEYLTSYTGAANWLIFESRGLYTLASLHPQFKQSPKWKEIGIGRGYAQYLGQFKSDGWHYEVTPNYHMESTNSISEFEKIANLNGEKTQIREGLKKAFDVEMFFTLPGGRFIPANDTGLVDVRGVMRNSASLIGEITGEVGQEYLFGSSDTRAGKPPTNSSQFYEYPGYLVMRDFWGANNITAFFEGGDSGMGHGWSSKDKLQFVMSAFGRDMLLEGGVYSYTGEPIAKYMYSTIAHNAITVDGEDQIRRKNGMEDVSKDITHHAGKDFDYSSSLYNENFGETRQIPVEHNRKVTFDKNGFFVITDRLTGEGVHDVSQYWNIASGKYEHEKQTNKITAKYDDGTGFVIIPVSRAPLKCDIVQGGEEPLRGWHSSSPNQAVAIPSIRFYADQTEIPLTIDTLIIPFMGDAPKIKIEILKTDDTATGLKITMGDGRTVYYMTNHNGGGEATYGSFSFDGEMALITKNTDKTVNIKKVPKNSILKENNNVLSNVTVELTAPKSGEVINTKTAVLSANVEGEETGDVTFFANYSVDGKKQTVQIGKCAVGETAIWDLTGIENQSDMECWAVISDGGTSNISSNRQKEISRIKDISATSLIELEDRAVYRTGGAVTMHDGRASQSMAVVLANGEEVGGTFIIPASAKVEVSAKATNTESAAVIVTVNGEERELQLTNQYKWYELGEYDKTTEIKFTNLSDNYISVDCIRFSGDGIASVDNKVLHHRVDLADDNVFFGESEWKDYVLSAKLQFRHVYGLSSAGAGITARNAGDTGHGLYYDSKAKQLQIRQREAANWSVIAKTDFEIDKMEWYNFKLKAEGNTISAKVWKTGDDEPSDWLITATVTAIQSGAGGINCNRVDLLIDDIKVTSADGENTLYSMNMENVLNGSRPGGWTVTKSDSWFCDDIKIINKGEKKK